MVIFVIIFSLYIVYFLLNVLKFNEYLYELYLELCICIMCIKYIYFYVY